MATTTYGTEYVQSSDLVSNWPGSSLNVANRIDNVSLVGNGLNNQTGTSYTLVLADGGKLVTFSNAAAIALTVPTNASVAFPTGVRIKLTNKGAGLVTVAGAGGVTLNGNQLTIPQNRSAMLYKLDTNTWVMTADLAGDPGLAYITSSAFSASSAVNVNNCFTSTYENYLVTVNADVSTSAASTMRMRVSAADNSTSNYRWAGYYQDWAITLNGDASTAQTSWPLSTNDGQIEHQIVFLSPQSARRTRVIVHTWGNTRSSIVQMSFDATTQFDGFSIIQASGTITGTLRVYGYRNS